MKTSKPTRHYSGVFTDTRNWDSFEHRAGDVFICVPPKSGTTWMQTMCGLLILGDPDAQVSYPEMSPWIDFRLSSKSIETRLATLSAQTHQRFIKTHSPLDGIPIFEECIYLMCHRHPLDVHFSMGHHVNNMKIDHIDHLYTQDTAANFDAFLENGVEGEGLDQPSLELIAHHYKTAKALSDRSNVHMFHYASLSQNLHAQMLRLADAIGVSHPPKHFDRLVEKATFKSMKADAAFRAPGAENGLYKDPAAFFNSGTGGKWLSQLDEAQLARYRQRIGALLTPEDVSYLETGLTPEI